jgi:hypothetical protein
MTKSEVMEELCNACPHMRKSVDTEEFWGFPCQRTTYECEYVCGSPEDPQCPEHGRWARIVAAGEVDGNYRLEDGDKL